MRVVVGALALLLVGPAAEAQTGAFVSVNALVQHAATMTFSQVGTGPSREETATLSSSQTFGTSLAYDVGGGVLHGGPRWKAGVGVAVSRTQERPSALVSLTLPHPILFSRSATATFTSGDGLERRETATHIQALLESRLGRVTVRLFAGPSHVRLAHILVSDVQIRETLDFSPQLAYAVAITGLDTSRVAVSAWGYHVGADAGFFFSRHVGAGALVRYTRATAKVPNGLQTAIDGGTATSEETLGGVSVGGGVRLRF